MIHTVTANEAFQISFAPKTLAEEVLQNVATILSTIKNTVPLFRDFGMSATFLDMPMPAAENLMIVEIFDAIQEYEPRAEILSISFVRDELAGKIAPTVEVSINEQ